MELIDREALRERSMPVREFMRNNLDLHVVSVNQINKMPTIDAEPVVRCKDCQHWGTGYGGETDNIKVCEYANYMVGQNGYCVYGERKMDLEVQDDG